MIPLRMLPGEMSTMSVLSPADHDEVEMLRALVEGTSRSTGEAFFQNLVTRLVVALDVHAALVAEFTAPLHARTLAYYTGGRIVETVEWDLPGTPCEDVVKGDLCFHPDGVWRKFPQDESLAKAKIESYLGVPLTDANGEHLGHLAVFHTRPMEAKEKYLFTFRLFAARAAAELERMRMNTALKASEKRFRSLYEDAPIAYLHETVDSQFVSANRAAQRLLGISPEDVPNVRGLSLIAPVPEMQQRIAAALTAIREGKSQSAIELELRRKDDGKPVWVQWWSVPDPDGQHMRTMLIDITDRVIAQQEQKRLEAQNLYLREEIQESHNYEEIVGRSPLLLKVFDAIGHVSPTDASVLITGETGTGKELVARAIHTASNRRGRPLIKVNCAALPTGLVESELFGHEKGAFSGAISRRVGRFELAHGGTIFLDEVGELPPDVQAKLLRVLQEREFERVGGSSSIRVDVRILAATNRDLAAAVKAGTFREDLYYRLSIFPIPLPPLRERKGDIPILLKFLVEKFKMRLGKPLEEVTPESMERLLAYHWPGNVRELENVLERAAILANGPWISIDAAALPADAHRFPIASIPAGSALSLRSVERDHVLSVLERTQWVIDGENGAARILNIHPNTLRSRLKKLGIARPLPTNSRE